MLAIVHELLKSGKVDLDYLIAYTNAPVLVIQEPGAADDGLFLRGADDRPLAWDREAGVAVSALDPYAKPALTGVHQVNGRRCVPVFQLLAERYLDDSYSPDAVAGTLRRRRGDHPADRRRTRPCRLRTGDRACPWHGPTGPAAATRRCAAGRSPCTRCAASRPTPTASTPAAPSICCRCCSAPSTFPAASASSRLSRNSRRRVRNLPARTAAEPMTPLSGMPLGFVLGPEDLLVDEAGKALRIDKAYSWEAPLAAHGLMHTVIRNAWAGDPYRIDTLFLYMANMAWNSSMNTVETIRMLTDKDESRRIQDPLHHLFRRLLFRDGSLRRPRTARHDLSRAPRLHQPARPADQPCRRARRRDPPSGRRARPRRAAIPDGADRARRAARPAGLRQGRRIA